MAINNEFLHGVRDMGLKLISDNGFTIDVDLIDERYGDVGD
jgi:hypothetical protein